MREMFDEMFAPDRYYRLAADDIRQNIVREVEQARDERDHGLRSAQDPWAVLDLIDVVGIRDVGILVFFRLPQTRNRIHIYIADVISLADIERASAAIEAGQPAGDLLGEGYDVFNDDFVFSFPAFTAHVNDVVSLFRTHYYTIDPSKDGDTRSLPHDHQAPPESTGHDLP